MYVCVCVYVEYKCFCLNFTDKAFSGFFKCFRLRNNFINLINIQRVQFNWKHSNISKNINNAKKFF